MQNCKVNVLGTEYEIIHQTTEENSGFSDCDGVCDPSTKIIRVRKGSDNDNDWDNAEVREKKTVRHEIIHAFFYESGLNVNTFHIDVHWAVNEEMIDWFAIQSPKIFKAFEEAGAL